MNIITLQETLINFLLLKLKIPGSLTFFTSPDYSLVMTQIVFVAMVFSLIQLYVSSKKLQNLAHRTMQTWKARELMGTDAVIVYYKFFVFLGLFYPKRKKLQKIFPLPNKHPPKSLLFLLSSYFSIVMSELQVNMKDRNPFNNFYLSQLLISICYT